MEPLSPQPYLDGLLVIRERVEASENAYHRDLTLHAVAVALFKKGHQDMAFEVRSSIKDKSLNATALIDMLKPFYRHRVDKIVEIVLGLPVDWVHEKASEVALTTIITHLVKLGHLKKALEVWKEVGKDSILQSIGYALSEGKLNSPYFSIVVEFVRLDDIEGAIKFVRPEMTMALIYLSEVLLKRGDCAKAIELASQVEEKYSKALAFKRIAMCLLQNGKTDEALEVGDKILIGGVQDNLLQAISKILVQKREFEKAFEISMRIGDDYQRAVALMYAAMGDELEKGIKVMRLIPRSWRDKITTLINGLDKNNPALLKLAKAQDDLDLAEGIVKALNDDFRSEGLVYLFDIWIKRGNIDKAFELGYAIPDLQKKKDAFLGLMRPLMDEGKLEASLALAETFRDSRIKGSAILLIITGHVKAGAFERALQLVEKLVSDFHKSSALLAISKELMLVDKARARNVANSIPDKAIREWALNMIGS